MSPVREAAELERLRSRKRRLLAVFPHPDDESYGSAGAFARAASDPDSAAVLLCLTRGEASSMGPRLGLTPREVGDLRVKRLEEVARITDLEGLIVCSFPDGRLARVPLDEVSAAVLAVIRAFRPQVVIGHDPRGVNGHPDHIASHWAVRHALLEEPDVRFAMISYTADAVEAVKPYLLFATPQDEIDAVLDLTDEEIAAKEACLVVHEAIVTLREHGDPALVRRPPLELYDFLGESLDPPATGLFDRLRT